MKTYSVPPFNGKIKEPVRTFHWWSWHPLYPYWSKSCWGGATKAEALKERETPCALGLDVYHNKLVQEVAGKLIEVADDPVRRTDVWKGIAQRHKKGELAEWIRKYSIAPLPTP